MKSVERRAFQDCPMCGSSSIEVVFVRECGEAHWSLARCQSCGLHFTDPRPSEEFLANLYSDDYHMELRAEGGTERAFEAKYRRYSDWLSSHQPLGRFLDIGCSTGLLVRMLRDLGYEAEGIEFNRQSAEWGRQHYGVKIHDKPMEQCGFEPESFDAVALTDVLEHTLHPREFLRSVGDLLAPGGLVLVTFPDIRSLESRYFFLMMRLTGRKWLWHNCRIPAHIWEFTKETARACFEGAGFRIIDFRRSHQAEEGEPWTKRLISLPAAPLRLPPVAARFGTQMEFILRKDDKVKTTQTEPANSVTAK
ncbi:MAG: class I SAM-dependent methyltransferase [Isosphaeraceae bacterium]